MQLLRHYAQLSRFVRRRGGLTAAAYFCTFAELFLQLLQPLIWARLIDDVLIARRADATAGLLIASLGACIGSAVLSTVRSGLFRYLGILHTLDIRDHLLKHIRCIPLPEIEKHGPGKFSALLGMDAAALGNFLNHVAVELLSQLFTAGVALSILFSADWKLGAAACVCMPAVLLLPRLIRRPLNAHLERVRSHNEEIGAQLFESIEGSREIRTLGLERWEAERNRRMYAGLVRSSARETLLRVAVHQSGGLLIGTVIVAVYWIGSRQVLADQLSVGMLAASVAYLGNALHPVQTINHFFGEMQSSKLALARIEDFLRTPVDVFAGNDGRPAGGEAAATPESAESAVQNRSLGKDVVVKGLTVRSGDTDILRGIDFTVSQGRKAAFIGKSGSGKTTLFKALSGLVPVHGGEISVGGRPLHAYSRKELIALVGVVFQEPFIFKGTVYENIAIGDFDRATPDAVYKAACQANLREWVDRLPDGLYTQIDHRGFQLSGGQRQRIAIARMFLRKPPILLLDEPTSALDRITEGEVIAALDRLMENKTTLIATHRLETIERADMIFVLENGRIAETGTHRELATRPGAYAAMLSALADTGT